MGYFDQYDAASPAVYNLTPRVVQKKKSYIYSLFKEKNLALEYQICVYVLNLSL